MDWTIFWQALVIFISLVIGIASFATAWVLPDSEAFKKWNKIVKIVSIASLAIVTCLCLATIIGIMKWNALGAVVTIIILIMCICSI